MKDVITIDGPSGAGKGTISKLLAKKLGYHYLDTGALYRAVAWKVRKEHIDPEDDNALRDVLHDIKITFQDEHIFVDGIDISAAIRTAEIGELSSQVSAVPAVRESLFAIQREMGLKGKVVIEGRDTGTVIFPESEHKFYLDASLDERARRRYEELKVRAQTNPGELTIVKVMEDIKKRDARDSSRSSAPLTRTDDMTYIDSTHMTIDEVVSEILTHLK